MHARMCLNMDFRIKKKKNNLQKIFNRILKTWTLARIQ